MRRDLLDRRARVAAMLLAGEGRSEIAAALGVARSTVDRDVVEIVKVTTTPTPRPRSMVDATDEAIEAMVWLTPADQSAVAMVRTYAWRIDEAARAGDEQEITKALYLGPHLLNGLRELGGTPAARDRADEDRAHAPSPTEIETDEEDGVNLASVIELLSAPMGNAKGS